MSKFKTKYTREILEEAVACSTSVTQVVISLGLTPRGGSISHISKRIKALEIPWPHYIGGKCSSANKKSGKDILVYNPKFERERGALLRRALLEAGVVYKCIKCGLGDQWQSEPITLQVDHIDGDIRNNLQDNLRFLCPNCHTQTANYAKKKKITEHSSHPIDMAKILQTSNIVCALCHKTKAVKSHLAGKTIFCSKSCYNASSKRCKIKWPDADILRFLVQEVPVTQVAQKLSVSGNAVKKHCKKLGIPVPPRGFWQKKQAGKIQ